MRFATVRAAELHHQPAAALGQKPNVFGMEVNRLHVGDQAIVDAFEPDRAEFENLADVIGCAVDVRIAEHEQRAARWTVHQPHRRPEHRYTRTFRTDEGARYYEAWAAASMGTPPVFIVVCSNTSVSKLVYDWIAGWERQLEDGTTVVVPGNLPLLSNVSGGQFLHRPPRPSLSLA